MAFGRLERKPGSAPIGEINMTPLIDVMLVLLVIFMITAPLMSAGLKLDLPKSEAAQPTATPEFVNVAVAPNGDLYFAEEKVDAALLRERLRDAARRTPGIEVHLRADQGVAYGRVAELIGWLQQAGLNRIAFVAEAPAR